MLFVAKFVTYKTEKKKKKEGNRSSFSHRGNWILGPDLVPWRSNQTARLKAWYMHFFFLPVVISLSAVRGFSLVFCCQVTEWTIFIYLFIFKSISWLRR